MKARTLAFCLAVVALAAPVARADASSLTAPPCADTVSATQPTVKAATAIPVLSLASIDTVRHVAESPITAHQLLIPLLAFAIMGTLRTVAQDRDTYFVGGTVLQQLNKFFQFEYYSRRNGLMSTTVATLPVVAQGSNVNRVKTTNATVVKIAGAALAVNATDNAWTLTGGNLAVGQSRKYLLLVAAGSVFSVQATTDQAVLANCRIDVLPADGKAIVGILSITNGSSAVFTPDTTSLSAAGITVAFSDGPNDDAVFTFGLIGN